MKKTAFIMLASLMLLFAASRAEGMIPVPPKTPDGGTVEETVVQYFSSIGIDAALTERGEDEFSFDLGDEREFAQRTVILEQDALPPVDEKLFSDDPLERVVMRAVMDYNNEKKAPWHKNSELWQTLCAVHIYDVKETKEQLMVWASVREGQYALFGGKNIMSGSGSIVPTRLTFVKDEAGNVTLTEYLMPGDGTDYWPSIQKMCEGRLLLAERIIHLPYDTLNAEIEKNLMMYLDSTGLYHPDAQAPTGD